MDLTVRDSRLPESFSPADCCYADNYSYTSNAVDSELLESSSAVASFGFESNRSKFDFAWWSSYCFAPAINLQLYNDNKDTIKILFGSCTWYGIRTKLHIMYVNVNMQYVNISVE